MKKTTNIHIKGVAFIMEEDAFQLLDNYLLRLRKNLGDQQGAEEIVEDIELRIAELLNEKTKSGLNVIEERHVSEVIAILGDPNEYAINDFDNVQPTEKEEIKSPNAAEEPMRRSLFRDKENGWIGGVCAGLATYLNINVTLIRLALILFVMMGGSGILIYLIMWVIIPKPKTTLDYLRMKGKPINLESIKEQFSASTNQFTQNAKDAAGEMTDQARNLTNTIRNNAQLDKTGAVIGKVLRVGIGIILLGMAVSILVGLMTFLFSDTTIIRNNNAMFTSISFTELVFETKTHQMAAIYSFLAVFGSFALFLLVSALTVILNYSSKLWKYSTLTLIAVGLSGILIGAYIVTQTIIEYSENVEIEESSEGIAANELFVTVNTDQEVLENGRVIKYSGNNSLYNIKGEYLIDRGYKVRYEKSIDSLFYVKVVRYSQGRNEEKALQNANDIEYSYTINGNNVDLSSIYKFPKKDKIRGQNINVIFYIPENKELIFANDTIHFRPTIQEEVQLSTPDKYYGYIKQDGTPQPRY